MRRPDRLEIINGSLLVFAVVLVFRSAYVQLWQGNIWAAQARHEHTAPPTPAQAPRGPILDAAGSPLAITRDVVELAVSPRDVRDRAVLARALLRAGVPVPWVKRATDVGRRWVAIPTRVFPGPAGAATALRGVYATPVAERLALGPPGLAAIVGHVGADGLGSDGIEAALDSVLRGSSGEEVVLRDGMGRPLESPSGPSGSLRTGDAVVLTINQALQEIAERALDAAIGRMSASGGDIVVVDPHDGSVLALASRRVGSASPALTSVTEPFEPGSTLKPFIASALMARGRVAPGDVVDTHAGRLEINGRTVTDTHHADHMTLREVIRWSSNVGIVQFAERLSPAEEYMALRDVGFGSPAGVPFAGEAAGTLHQPAQWSKQSPASLAIGYEIAVTPLQLALAYASIANGGELLEPALVREIRGPDGSVRYHHERRVVRRVMSEGIARELREILIETVAHGTASEADLSSFVLAGKTGTARRTQFGGGYGRNEYTASFVGLFPGRDPQYVILVKLDDPTGAYFGGATAAPVSKAILEAAIAARDAALDRGALAAGRRVALIDTAPQAGAEQQADFADLEAAGAGSTVTIPLEAAPGIAAPPRDTTIRVPDVRGLALRPAARALHRAGFRVDIVPGQPRTTVPAAGTLARRGAVIRLGGEP
jgi:cell division protein FtsI (penicillin-binding protein 3)